MIITVERRGHLATGMPNVIAYIVDIVYCTMSCDVQESPHSAILQQAPKNVIII